MLNVVDGSHCKAWIQSNSTRWTQLFKGCNIKGWLFFIYLFFSCHTVFKCYGQAKNVNVSFIHSSIHLDSWLVWAIEASELLPLQSPWISPVGCHLSGGKDLYWVLSFQWKSEGVRDSENSKNECNEMVCSGRKKARKKETCQLFCFFID